MKVFFVAFLATYAGAVFSAENWICEGHVASIIVTRASTSEIQNLQLRGGFGFTLSGAESKQLTVSEMTWGNSGESRAIENATNYMLTLVTASLVNKTDICYLTYPIEEGTSWSGQVRAIKMK